MAQFTFLSAFAQDKGLTIEDAQKFIDTKINKHLKEYCKKNRYTSKEVREALQLVDRAQVYETGIFSDESNRYYFDFIEKYYFNK